MRDFYNQIWSICMKKSYQSIEGNSTNDMKQVINRKLTTRFLLSGLIFLLTFSTSLFAQDGDPANGNHYLTPIVLRVIILIER